MQTLHEHYRDNANVAVIGVHYDDKGDVAAFVTKSGHTFEIVPDGRGVVSEYGIKKIPSFVIVGTDGDVILNQVGFAEGDEDKFRSLIDANLNANR